MSGKTRDAFTLIEILIVVVIMAVLACAVAGKPKAIAVIHAAAAAPFSVFLKIIFMRLDSLPLWLCFWTWITQLRFFSLRDHNTPLRL